MSVATFSSSGSKADDAPRRVDVTHQSFQRLVIARRRGKVTDLDAASADESEMLRPRLRLQPADDAGDRLEPRGVDRFRRSQAEGGGVDDDGNEEASMRSAGLLRRRVDEVFRENLDDVDPIGVREDRRADFGTPSQAGSHPPHPPQPPPHPPPQPDPHPELLELFVAGSGKSSLVQREIAALDRIRSEDGHEQHQFRRRAAGMNLRRAQFQRRKEVANLVEKRLP